MKAEDVEAIMHAVAPVIRDVMRHELAEPRQEIALLTHRTSELERELADTKQRLLQVVTQAAQLETRQGLEARVQSLELAVDDRRGVR